MNDPKPLAPGEKVGFKWNGDDIKVFEQKEYQEEVYKRVSSKSIFEHARKTLESADSREKRSALIFQVKYTTGNIKHLAGIAIISS